MSAAGLAGGKYQSVGALKIEEPHLIAVVVDSTATVATDFAGEIIIVAATAMIAKAFRRTAANTV